MGAIDFLETYRYIFFTPFLLCFSPIPVNVDDADKNKLIRTSPQPIPPREEEENFGGPSKYPPEPRARSYEHFKVWLSFTSWVKMNNLEEILVVVFCSINFLSSDSTLETTFLGLRHVTGIFSEYQSRRLLLPAAFPRQQELQCISKARSYFRVEKPTNS